MLRTLFTFQTEHKERPAPGRSSLYGLDRGKFENRLIMIVLL